MGLKRTHAFNVRSKEGAGATVPKVRKISSRDDVSTANRHVGSPVSSVAQSTEMPASLPALLAKTYENLFGDMDRRRAKEKMEEEVDKRLRQSELELENENEIIELELEEENSSEDIFMDINNSTDNVSPPRDVLKINLITSMMFGLMLRTRKGLSIVLPMLIVTDIAQKSKKSI